MRVWTWGTLGVSGTCGALVMSAIGIGALVLGCSQASRSLQYSSPSPDPGVVYVAEQVNGLDDWVRAPDSRSYARVTTRSGQAEEGQLLRINHEAVVIASKRTAEVTIPKQQVLFMRVWW